jgi:hypothetical protein
MHGHAFSMQSSHARFRGGGSCATTCGTQALGSRFTWVVRRLPMATSASAKPNRPSYGAQSDLPTDVRLHSSTMQPFNGSRIGSGCRAYVTLDSTYLRARLARIIQGHLRLHRFDRLGSSIDRVEIVLHEQTRERSRHGRRWRVLAFYLYHEITLRILQSKVRVPGSIHSNSQCFLDDRHNCI